MRNYKLLLVWIIIGGTMIGCNLPSTPKDPNFRTSHKIEAPLLFEKTFQFLGGEGDTEVLIDTTGTEFDSLFVVTEGGVDNGLITLSREEEFEFGDLNDAIPEISTDPTNFEAEVGELEIGSFQSGNGALGTVDIRTVTGNDPNIIPVGFPIPAGDNSASPVRLNIGANTDFFASATVKSGAIIMEITNELGFDFRVTQIQLIDTVTTLPIGGVAEFSAANGNQLTNGSTQTASIDFTAGDVLQNLGVQITMFWDGFNFPADPQEVTVESVNGDNLVASSVVAALTPQNFSTQNSSTIDATEFQFTSANHFVELESGTITIAPINNQLDLTVESLVISFPTILAPPYNASDSLVISYTGANRIFRNSLSNEQVIDLANHRIFALNNTIEYNISALTEDTQAPSVPEADQKRTISETDRISSSVEITNLTIAEAFGEIATQTVLLGDDDAANGADIIDLYNETEVSLTEIDGLEDLSSEIDGIEFAGASLSINYTSNIGVPTTIYGAILGVDGEGQEIYLTGLPGTDKEVQAGDPIAGIQANGQQLAASQMIKFSLDVSPDGSLINGVTTFSDQNTNVLDFLNNLPSEIRFVGKAVINESGTEASIATPLEFDPGFLVDLPIFFSADAASLDFKEDGSDLEDLPGEGDDSQITEGRLIVSYDNALPLGFDIEISFLDVLGDTITSVPLPGDMAIELQAASVNGTTRFVDNSIGDSFQITLTESQLLSISNTDSIAVNAALNTFATEAVKIRDTDSITLSVSASFTIETDVNND